MSKRSRRQKKSGRQEMGGVREQPRALERTFSLVETAPMARCSKWSVAQFRGSVSSRTESKKRVPSTTTLPAFSQFMEVPTTRSGVDMRKVDDSGTQSTGMVGPSLPVSPGEE